MSPVEPHIKTNNLKIKRLGKYDGHEGNKVPTERSNWIHFPKDLYKQPTSASNVFAIYRILSHQEMHVLVRLNHKIGYFIGF